MTSISFTGTNPTVSLNRSVGDDKNARDLYNAKIILADEMKRLYPDGVMKVNSDRPVLFYQSALEQIVNNGTLNDANGTLQSVSPEARKAAQTILDNGGPALFNPNGAPWFSEGDLRKSIANDPLSKNPIEQFDDFLNRQRGNKV